MDYYYWVFVNPYNGEITGIVNAEVDSYGNKDSVQGIYRGSTAGGYNDFTIEEGAPVQVITFDNEEYYLELK